MQKLAGLLQKSMAISTYFSFSCILYDPVNPQTFFKQFEVTNSK